ncbi:uracil-DNA glycosylase family protein [Marinobacterium lutimaris]|uniref:Uracil DNA glycosylase superfamily protein n=1 Tax=Marinobacterium lutimaris TaxID=568106 RepID=A0A1H6BKF4_9GAMM|nr:hypothetical protein [Marinobacterium lutimaris]SEG61163.1 Uracil DNA glycosylase superfamily protein [Marinobacterium lutimaris]
MSSTQQQRFQQEQQRHDYLSAIGITSWLPRTELPGAAASADWVAGFVHGQDDAWGADDIDLDLDQQPAAQSAREAIATLDTAKPAPASVSATESAPAAPVAPSVTPANQDARAAARASLELELPSDPKSASRPKPKAAQQGAQSDEADKVSVTPRSGPRVEAPRVKLAFMLAGDLLIVDSLPPAGRQGFGRQHQRLLQGILASLGQNEAASDAAILSWPVLAGASLNQGPDELAKAVARKLEYTLSVKPVTRALLFGESAAQWLLGREEELDALRGIRFTLQAGIACVASHSLSEALQVPEMKADIWRDLQPLLSKATHG